MGRGGRREEEEGEERVGERERGWGRELMGSSFQRCRVCGN